MKINFKDVFESLNKELSGNQKKIEVDSPLGVYYGLSKEGKIRLSFLSKSAAPKMESTKLLDVTQGYESKNTFWTCFDLNNNDIKDVFVAFCENLIESIDGIKDEYVALSMLKKRYITWKAMFKREPKKKLSREVLQGLFGELYFLKNYMFNNYEVELAVNAWSGPDGKSKDYSIEKDWFEVKTIGAKALTVHISSLEQLASSYDGHLAIIKVESMSGEFNNGESCIGDLIKYIMSNIHDETVEGIFLNKLSEYGFDSTNESFNAKFDVKFMQLYKVDDNFPRLTENNVPFTEICDTNYSLIINSLQDYMED